MAKILSIIAPEDFQDQEYSDSKTALEVAGHEVVTASTVAAPTGKFGATAQANIMLADVNPDDYDAIAFIGGPGVYGYFEDEIVLNLAKTFLNANKPTCAICAAPGILANAGLLQGKSATCWPGEGDHLKEKGTNYTGKPVEQDGLIITADGPTSAKAFGEAIAKVVG
tara:strand:+ start:552 stop:1055 length:504 start_codon:yes stop_codon:yes gene_type:complete